MQEELRFGDRCRLRMEKARDLCMGIRVVSGDRENSYCILIKISEGFCFFFCPGSII